jgi:hypothetical protein
VDDTGGADDGEILEEKKQVEMELEERGGLLDLSEGVVFKNYHEEPGNARSTAHFLLGAANNDLMDPNQGLEDDKAIEMDVKEGGGVSFQKDNDSIKCHVVLLSNICQQAFVHRPH